MKKKQKYDNLGRWLILSLSKYAQIVFWHIFCNCIEMNTKKKEKYKTTEKHDAIGSNSIIRIQAN